VFAGPASGGSGAPSFRALVAADIPAITVPWSSLANATAALTLNNSTFSTTFNQAAGDIWTWGLPSYTAAVSNSPTLELAGSYQSAAATFAKDFWTITDTIGAGTNGQSLLVISHTGSTGAGAAATATPVGVSFPQGNLDFGSSPAISFSSTNNGVNYNFFSQRTGGLTIAVSPSGAPGVVNYQSNNQGFGHIFVGNWVGQAGGDIMAIGNASTMTGTTGAFVGLDVGANVSKSLTFTPASGSASFTGIKIAPTLSGTTSGATTGLLVNPTYTLAGLTGVNSLLDLQASSVSKFTVNVSGHINNTSGDVQGTLTSASGTTVSKVYTTAYVSTPTVVVTPTSSLTSWFISASSNTGFTITYAPTGAASFNYFVHGNPT
jgi:hypothetical protein